MSRPEPDEDGRDLLESGSLDLTFLRTLASDAAAAVACLWDSPRNTFWRSTEHRALEESKPPTGMFPTVTFRSLEALLQLIENYPAWADTAVVNLAVNQAIPAILSSREEDLRSTLGLTSEGDVLNPFTLSLYIRCLTLICSCKRTGKDLQEETLKKLETACRHLLTYTKLANAANTGPDVHPFVLFHVTRAIEAAVSRIRDKDLGEQLTRSRNSFIETVREQVRKLLAQDSLGVMNPSEGVALAFCAAALATCRTPEEIPFVNAALRVAFKFQDTSGCWPLGRIVPENKDIEVKRDLQIPTYEIAWGLTEAVATLVESRKDSLQDRSIQEAFNRLVKATTYTAASTVQLDSDRKPNKGWCSEHAFGKPIIESWTSATTLQSVLSFYELARMVDRQLILRKFASASPRDADWPSWQRWREYKIESEPEQHVRVLEYLDRRIVQTILASPGQLPSSTSKNASILLFGPPGTAKTSVVRAMADGLNWPVLSLSPGNFIERGLEYIEAQAKKVFDMLQRLSNVVVLFDECDELFRDRRPVPGTDQVRNITAFVTASMLPKLQDLHDRGRVVFAICTNHLESMDPAIKRGGRIDHILGIGPPDKVARRRIIEKTVCDKLTIAHVGDGADELASQTERFTRSEIERAAKLFDRVYKSAEEARESAVRIAEAMKQSLTISAKEFDDFNRLKQEYSHPHLERGLK